MKYLAKDDSLCIKCHQCEEACAKAYFKTDDVEKSCIRITEDTDAVINVCNQCGECIDICPIEILTRDRKGVVRINKKDCVGCFMCVGFCPEEAMIYHDDHIEPFKCIACGLCAKQCPTGAIFITEKEEKAKDQVAVTTD